MADDRFTRLLNISPSLAVLDLWNDIELALDPIVKKSGQRPIGSASGILNLRSLAKDGFVDPSVASAINRLRKTRKAAAGEGTSIFLKRDVAIEFRDAAIPVLSSLAAQGATGKG